VGGAVIRPTVVGAAVVVGSADVDVDGVGDVVDTEAVESSSPHDATSSVIAAINQIRRVITRGRYRRASVEHLRVPWTGMGLMHWIFGKHPPRPPDPERTCEAAWLPMWQAQLVLYELWESDIPAVMSEDFTSHLRFAAREPMARIFVTEPRLVAATEVIERVTGFPPAHQGN
jgi:hypothetical protein